MNALYAAFPICRHPNNTASNTLKLIHLLVRINIDRYNIENAHREALIICNPSIEGSFLANERDLPLLLWSTTLRIIQGNH